MIQTKSVLVFFRVGSLAYCLGQPSFHIFINAAGHWTNSVLVSYSKTSQAMRASAVKQRVASIGQGTKEQTRGRSVGRTGRPIRHRKQWFASFPHKQKNQSKKHFFRCHAMCKNLAVACDKCPCKEGGGGEGDEGNQRNYPQWPCI